MWNGSMARLDFLIAAILFWAMNCLRVQQIFGALALILTGAFMFTTRGNEWIACLTIAAILELYTAFRIPQEEEKERA